MTPIDERRALRRALRAAERAQDLEAVAELELALEALSDGEQPPTNRGALSALLTEEP